MKRDLPAARPGLEGLEKAMKQLYPLQEPLLFRTPEDCQSLMGIAIYRGDPNQIGPHWHYITLGLTELFGKESDNRAVSGWGIELTLKTPMPVSYTHLT